MTLTRKAGLRRSPFRAARRRPVLDSSAVEAGYVIAGHRGRDVDVPPENRAAVRARSGGRCEAALPGVCTVNATDVHHRRRRRDGGHEVANLLDLCRACHRWAHDNPARARELGVIVSVYADPARTPAFLPSRFTGARVWVQLTEDGTYLIAAEAPA